MLQGALHKPKALKPLKKGFFDKPKAQKTADVGTEKAQATSAAIQDDREEDDLISSLYSCQLSSDADRKLQKRMTKKKRGKKIPRCQVCAAVVSVVVQCMRMCKCNGVFCQEHRLPESHNCRVDHKSESPKLGPATNRSKVELI